MVVVAQVQGVIDPINAQYLSRVLGQAEAAGADLLVIELNTPGGLSTAMETMTERLLGASVPSVVYVTPTGARAGSAGVFIAMAADVVAMAPGTVIGAAHPISVDGGQLDEATTEKFTNYAATYARTLATTKGHNADWAEQAVRASATLTEQEALQQKVADLVANDLGDLLQQVAGRRVRTAAGERVLPALLGASVQRYPPNAAEAALHVIADPNIALLLLTIGTIGIFAELYHPGGFFPGIVGVISLLLAYVSLGNLPTNWGAAALICFSILLFMLELHVPTHGVLGIGGVVAFVLGGLLLFAPLTPTAPVIGTIEVNHGLLFGLSGLLAAFFLVALRAGLRARRLPRSGALTHLTGARGLVTSRLNPVGTVLVNHEQWSALTSDGPIESGAEVEVVAREGLRLRVRPITGGTPRLPENPPPQQREL
jgi:membrane-bound serine protease (ClpP class)